MGIGFAEGFLLGLPLKIQEPLTFLPYRFDGLHGAWC